MIEAKEDRILIGECSFFLPLTYDPAGSENVVVRDSRGYKRSFNALRCGYASQEEMITELSKNNIMNTHVGKNETTPKLKDDIHFDLAPTSGTDTLGSKTGKLYDLAALKDVVVARGAKYKGDGSNFVATDDIIEVEADLQFENGVGYNEGDPSQEVIATTSSASYQNNESWTRINSGGGRNDGEEKVTTLPTSVQNLFVENGSVLTVHVTFQKA